MGSREGKVPEGVIFCSPDYIQPFDGVVRKDPTSASRDRYKKQSFIISYKNANARPLLGTGRLIFFTGCGNAMKYARKIEMYKKTPEGRDGGLGPPGAKSLFHQQLHGFDRHIGRHHPDDVLAASHQRTSNETPAFRPSATVLRGKDAFARDALVAQNRPIGTNYGSPGESFRSTVVVVLASGGNTKRPFSRRSSVKLGTNRLVAVPAPGSSPYRFHPPGYPTAPTQNVHSHESGELDGQRTYVSGTASHTRENDRKGVVTETGSRYP
ncbi:hypothetical protein FQR65_LT20913 [Abscondita terminalis]|nr:hypothetical protein FQR65_LT20913 [Abscondita terminalis]